VSFPRSPPRVVLDPLDGQHRRFRQCQALQFPPQSDCLVSSSWRRARVHEAIGVSPRSVLEAARPLRLQSVPRFSKSVVGSRGRRNLIVARSPTPELSWDRSPLERMLPEALLSQPTPSPRHPPSVRTATSGAEASKRAISRESSRSTCPDTVITVARGAIASRAATFLTTRFFKLFYLGFVVGYYVDDGQRSGATHPSTEFAGGYARCSSSFFLLQSSRPDLITGALSSRSLRWSPALDGRQTPLQAPPFALLKCSRPLYHRC